MIVNISDVREFFSLKILSDGEISPHLQSAINTLKHYNFKNDWDQKEAISSLCIANLSSLLFSKPTGNLEGLETIYSSFEDVDSFRKLWQKRCDDILNRCDDTYKSSNTFAYVAI